MKITLNNSEETELTEREEKIYNKGASNTFWIGFLVGCIMASLGFLIYLKHL